MLPKVLSDLGVLFYLVPIGVDYRSIEEVPEYVLTAIPYFFLLIGLEILYGKWHGRELYTTKDTIMSLSLGITQQILQLWAKEVSIVFYVIAYDFCAPLRAPCAPLINISDSPSFVYQALVFFASLLAVDCGYYWFHRYAHEFHALWVSHSVHHSGERYNFATALRQGATQFLTSWVFYLPCAVIGISPAQLVRHNRLNTLYQFWIHTECIGRLPWFIELIFNTPSHHRLHHRPPGNCNYAGVLIIWDRIFGTFVSECDFLLDKNDPNAWTDDYPRGVIYGLAQPLNSFDPVFANIQHIVRVACTSPVPTLWNRVCHGIGFMFKKRVHHPIRIATDCKAIFADIIFDQVHARQCLGLSASMLDTMQFWFRRCFRLPPLVDESKPIDKRSWNSRDYEFLIGRLHRESPEMSSTMTALTIIHFVLTLVAALVLMLLCDSPLLVGKWGLAYTAIASITCIQSLRAISWRY